MCGIAGLIEFDTTFSETTALLAMTEAIRHRGPDDVGYIFGNAITGVFELLGGDDTPAAVFERPSPFAPGGHIRHRAIVDVGYNLGMSNRRLAIVDLSPLGHQPMCNEDRSLWLVYNGEIYNAPELTAELAQRGHRFTSATDTEVIVHAYEEWGDDCVAHLNGMWAFALWDIRRRRVFLSRDRVGIKPLYYWHDVQRFAFASEIKSLLRLGLPRTPNPQAIYAFLTSGRTDHTDMTFFEGIRPLLPAHTMNIDLDSRQISQKRYWSIDLNRRLDGRTDEQYAESFRALFEDAVRIHLISDVPVGTCLSGGLDSSAIVCAINKLICERGLHIVGMEARQMTFSARYEDRRHDEGHYIEAVAAACPVSTHMIYPTPGDLKESWQRLFQHLEEPFGSTSIFAQWCVFRLARQVGVTVTLDGQGSDEILAGYLGFFPYYFADLLMQGRWPQLVADFQAHRLLHGASARQELRNIISNSVPATLKSALKRRATNRTRWLNQDFLSVGDIELLDQQNPEYNGTSRLTKALLDSLTLNPLPAILRFEDRNSMAHSIESRVPFLDYRLIELCFALPTQQKIRHGTTKYILRQALCGIVPEEVRLRQDKIRFSTPQDIWLRGELASWAREILESSEFRQRFYFQADEVLELLARHSTGSENHDQTLWRCLATELWHRAMEV